MNNNVVNQPHLNLEKERNQVSEVISGLPRWIPRASGKMMEILSPDSGFSAFFATHLFGQVICQGQCSLIKNVSKIKFTFKLRQAYLEHQQDPK